MGQVRAPSGGEEMSSGKVSVKLSVFVEVSAKIWKKRVEVILPKIQMASLENHHVFIASIDLQGPCSIQLC